MSGIASNIAKQVVKDILETHSESQINLASASAREVLSNMIVLELEKTLRLSVQVSRPDYTDKTITMDMEDTVGA